MGITTAAIVRTFASASVLDTIGMIPLAWRRAEPAATNVELMAVTTELLATLVAEPAVVEIILVVAEAAMI